MTTEAQQLNPSIVILKTGEKLITILQEAFEGEGEDQKGICLVMNHPYELALINVNNQENPEQDLQVKFSRWCPYAVDTQYRIPYDGVLAIGQPDAGLAQAYKVKIKQAQDKLITVIKGKILDVVVDIRKNSKTFGKHFKIILSENNAKFLYVPKGFAHGFLGLEKENIVVYYCSNYRNPKYERSINWNDKSLKINWGIKKPIISKKDKNAILLKDFINLYGKKI